MQLKDAPDHITLVYKSTGDQSIYVDIYPPASTDADSPNPKLPAVVYFHGGSLTVGNRKSWFPNWLHRRVTLSGMAFISADYTLLGPASGHDILADVKDLFHFLDTEVNQRIRGAYDADPSRVDLAFEIDSQSLAVAGSSAGGLCAYLAALYASPKPKAVLSLYGMGGDMLTWMYLAPKTRPFLRGREILDPDDYAEYLYPANRSLSPTSDSPLVYHPPTHHIPNFPANPRMLVGRLYLQTGTFLDYLTGSHESSLSASIRTQLSQDGVFTTEDPNPNSSSPSSTSSVHSEKYRELIPREHLSLFPQFGDAAAFPPTLLIHGSADSAVWIRESKNMNALLYAAGVPVELRVVEGKEHSFDYEQSAKQEFGGAGGLFNEAMDFLKAHLWNTR